MFREINESEGKVLFPDAKFLTPKWETNDVGAR